MPARNPKNICLKILDYIHTCPQPRSETSLVASQVGAVVKNPTQKQTRMNQVIHEVKALVMGLNCLAVFAGRLRSAAG